jgi:hypothetical protein
MPTNVNRTEGQPHDRLTRLAAAMTDALEAHPEYAPTVKCAIFLDDGNRGGIQLHGYEDDADAVVDLLVHLQAIFRASGKRLDVVTLDEDGMGRVSG